MSREKHHWRVEAGSETSCRCRWTEYYWHVWKGANTAKHGHRDNGQVWHASKRARGEPVFLLRQLLIIWWQVWAWADTSWWNIQQGIILGTFPIRFKKPEFWYYQWPVTAQVNRILKRQNQLAIDRYKRSLSTKVLYFLKTASILALTNLRAGYLPLGCPESVEI